jgi:hypothetical protein
LWLDCWHLDGYLMDRYGFQPVYDIGSCIDAKLSSIIKRGEWYWSYARSDLLVHIRSQLSLVKIGLDDQAVWKAEKRVYNCAETWDALRKKENVVGLWRIVWFSMAMPRHSFLLWLVFRDALTTKKKMCIWGYEGDILCPFCRAYIECRDHLFFKCSFSRQIWRNVMQSCLEHFPVVDWDEVAMWSINRLRGESLRTRPCKLSLGVVVYHIWIQRNNLLIH